MKMDETGARKKRWPIWLALGLAGLLAAWLGCILWFKVQVRRQIADLRSGMMEPKTPPATIQEAFFPKDLMALTEIQLQGCRALPALVEELDPEAPAEYLSTLSSLIQTAVFHSHMHERGSPEASKIAAKFGPLQIDKEDDLAERRRKCETLRRWWAEEGGAYHQAWRFWSTACKAPLSRDF